MLHLFVCAMVLIIVSIVLEWISDSVGDSQLQTILGTVASICGIIGIVLIIIAA